jgi:pimeloyl-ACP methyl ester carboxylesterase
VSGVAALDIPLLDLGGDGPDLHFAHANGFPAETYRRFLAPLVGRFHVLAMNARPLWPGSSPTGVRGWPDFADDLIAFLDAHARAPVVGMGHSLGAVTTALAAIKRPDLFRALVLVDPVFFPPGLSFFWRWMKRLGRADRLYLVRDALRRRRDWPDRETVLARYREVPAFARWDEGVLCDYVEGGTVPIDGGGVRLRYPPEWEAWIFAHTPDDCWRFIPKVPAPCLVVRGETSDTFREPALARMRRVLPAARTVTVPACGHFLPMERPETVADAALQFLAELSGKRK